MPLTAVTMVILSRCGKLTVFTLCKKLYYERRFAIKAEKKICFSPSTIAVAFTALNSKGTLWLCMDFCEPWTRGVLLWICQITTAAAARREIIVSGLMILCNIVFNIWGELRSYSSVDLNELSCSHTLEHSLVPLCQKRALTCKLYTLSRGSECL